MRIWHGNFCMKVFNENRGNPDNSDNLDNSRKKGKAGGVMKELFKQYRICAILRNIPSDQLPDYGEALYQGGIRLFEVALNSESAREQIHMLRRKFGDRAWVGAGTVTTKERCLMAREAGAQFFLTPSVSKYTLEFCRENHILLLPGVMTPSDVASCLEYGYHVLKLFPAGAFPFTYIKNLKGPFDHTEYVAVGGVSLQNVGKYLEAGYIGAGIGNNLVPAEYIRDRQWEKVEKHIKNLYQF